CQCPAVLRRDLQQSLRIEARINEPETLSTVARLPTLQSFPHSLHRRRTFHRRSRVLAALLDQLVDTLPRPLVHLRLLGKTSGALARAQLLNPALEIILPELWGFLHQLGNLAGRLNFAQMTLDL